MKERHLKGLTVQQVVDLLGSRKWNFFERRDAAGEGGPVIRIEAPVGTGESYVVELGPYKDKAELAEALTLLKARGFIEQEVRYIAD